MAPPPAVRSAERACAVYLPPAGGRHRRSALNNYAKGGLPAGINPQSPAFQSAARACGAGGGSIQIGG